ncbi:hypothetical protein [Geotalea uraniireducens]|uniref:Uncharacterized protein n=1 Tax=Geotalea uraniireducens (strain Rf4) TaxID=351605 RepID=A5G8Z8_GEOUR|nr:hypothetical protein [Geotalea uraniireducens]ABQ28266.1 hypothetical protein Gura_4123 [Geotalea uraniireducens Rf4]
MANGFDFKRLGRLITIYYVVQAFLLLLLAGVAFWFQAHVPSQIFINSILRTLVVQVIFFYPVYRFAAHEAKREVNSCSTSLSPADMLALRRKRLTGDIIKASLFIFFIIFILRAPQAPGAQYPILFVFILTTLCYFQCYNFIAKREMRSKG